MNEKKRKYCAPKVRTALCEIELGYQASDIGSGSSIQSLSQPIIDQFSLGSRGESNPQYETMDVNFSGNDGSFF